MLGVHLPAAALEAPSSFMTCMHACMRHMCACLRLSLLCTCCLDMPTPSYRTHVSTLSYVLLVAWFLFRVLRRRARRAKDQKLSGQVTAEEYENSWFNKVSTTTVTQLCIILF